MRHSKKLAALAIAAGVAITASAAFAYWTGSGSGSGSAQVVASSDVSIDNVDFANDLYPGGSTQVSFTIEGSADAPVTIAKVVADQGVQDLETSVWSRPNGIDGLPAGCSAGDFHFGDVTVGAQIAKGGHLDKIGRAHV